MRNKLKKDTKLIRIDSKLHKDLKRLAAAEEKSIKEWPGLSPGALCRSSNYRFDPKLKFIFDAIKNSCC